MSIGRQIVMMITLMITSKGGAAVPRSDMVILCGTLSSFDLPMQVVPLLLAVDTVMDMAATTVNCLGNCLATVIMSIHEGRFGNEMSNCEKGELEE